MDGFGGGAAQGVPVVTEGFGGTTAPASPTEGFATETTGPPPKVEGFGAAATPGHAPPVEGFGDSADNKGLGSSGEGYLDQEEEPDPTLLKKAVDVEPGAEEEEEEASEANRFVDMEPGWDVEEEISGQTEDRDRGEEEEAEARAEDAETNRYAPFLDRPIGKKSFTAQIKAAGYGSFHEQQMLLMKHRIEKTQQASEQTRHKG